MKVIERLHLAPFRGFGAIYLESEVVDGVRDTSDIDRARPDDFDVDVPPAVIISGSTAPLMSGTTSASLPRSVGGAVQTKTTRSGRFAVS
ncbi:hypothetical protein [Haladaptatus salinisoli]|uniref:hypothetical protein n=1 Tax=Haladaptatus salinisoli TaxID=2884876 RepID=UPI001D0A5AF6|nr:hypothetical protein [Haladaptatus salinisoli]